MKELENVLSGPKAAKVSAHNLRLSVLCYNVRRGVHRMLGRIGKFDCGTWASSCIMLHTSQDVALKMVSHESFGFDQSRRLASHCHVFGSDKLSF